MTKGLNYLVSAALAGLIWVVFGIFIGKSISDGLSLATTTPEDFLKFFQIVLGAGTLISLGLICYWYYYGSQDSTATRLDEAKRTWNIFFILEILLAVILIVVMVAKYRNEGVDASDWIILFAFLAMPTVILFWLATFFMSPRAVTYIPLFKR